MDIKLKKRGMMLAALGACGFVAACGEPIVSSTRSPGAPEQTQTSAAAPITLERRTSMRDFAQTVAAARTAMETRGFTIFAAIDHAAGAARVNASLPPTTTIIFGNPKGGTPLMQANRAIAIDLPLKLLVMETADGTVDLVWTPPATLLSRYGITDKAGSDKAGIEANITNAFAAIAAEAAGVDISE